MHDSTTRARATSLENSDVVDLHSLDRPGKPLLFVHRRRGMARLNPLGRRATIGRQQPRFDTVSMELPARIVPDAFKPNIHKIGPGDSGEGHDKIMDVTDQHVAHVPLGHVTVVQQRLYRLPRICRLRKKVNVWQTRSLKSIKPGFQAQWKRAPPDYKLHAWSGDEAEPIHGIGHLDALTLCHRRGSGLAYQ